jgi:hypothetical protein
MPSVEKAFEDHFTGSVPDGLPVFDPTQIASVLSRLHLSPDNLENSFINFNTLAPEFSSERKHVVSSANCEIFASSGSIVKPLMVLSRLIAIARSSTVKTNKKGANGQPCLTLRSSEKPV